MQFGVNLYSHYNTYKDDNQRYEYNEALQRVEKRTDLVSPGNRGFYMATESLGGSLNFNFYF